MREQSDRPVVALTTVSKSYAGTPALEAVTLAVHPGEVVALVGHNGAGKSTLLKLMLGLTRPDAGSVRLWGEDPAGRTAARLRRRLGYLPEAVSFDAGASGRALMHFYAGLKGLSRTVAEEALSSVGLAGAADRPVRTYSKGMRQRLGLAQAVLGDPELLVLDEPTTGLDPVLRDSLYARTQALRRRQGTVVLSSHALAEIEDQADRFVIMRQGRPIASGSLPELRASAGLPTRIRVAPGAGAGAGALCDALRPVLGTDATTGLRPFGGGGVEILCPPGRKLAVLRCLFGLDVPLEDVELREPGLEEIYAYHWRAGEDACAR